MNENTIRRGVMILFAIIVPAAIILLSVHGLMALYSFGFDGNLELAAYYAIGLSAVYLSVALTYHKIIETLRKGIV